MEVEMTGAEDRQGPWKFAIVGHTDLTLFASTADDPLMVFFEQHPRIKSIANRSIPHVKVINDYSAGTLGIDSLKMLIMHLSLGEHAYKTLCIDSGDTLFQMMKSGRTYENGGEFKVGDWGWIADAYREALLGIIDLPMDVIVNFHVKSAGEEATFKELMLQGAAKDEAPRWFDVVGALDAFELVDESGQEFTKRTILTSPTRTYPFLRDDSNALPYRFEISPDFVGDFPRMLEIVSKPAGEAPRQVIGQIPRTTDGKANSVQVDNNNIPSPEDLVAAKISEPPAAPIDKASTDEPIADLISKTVDHIKTTVEATAPEVGHSDSEQQIESAVEVVQNVLGGEQVFPCAVCGVNVDDESVRDLTQIRYRKYLCKPHFDEALKRKAG